MGSLQTYVRESYNELINKVTWPNYASLQSDTIVVIIATLILSLVIFLMDLVSNQTLKTIYEFNG